MDDTALARDRLLMAVLVSVVVHLLLVFGPFGPGMAGPPRITPEAPQSVELRYAAPAQDPPLRLITGGAPEAWRSTEAPPRAHQRHIDGTTRDAPAARYLRDWILQAERVGNRAYPRELIERGVTGRVVMAVTLNAEGEVIATRMPGEPGGSALERAARRLVHAAAPFPAVPAEVLQGRSELVITRVWSFGEARR